MSEEVPTDPLGHTPPESEPHPATAAAERFASLVGTMLKPIRDDMAAHQREEMAHHRRIDAGLDLLREYLLEMRAELSALQSRVARLEGIVPTERPPEDGS